jgi:hypothetical protein
MGDKVDAKNREDEKEHGETKTIRKARREPNNLPSGDKGLSFLVLYIFLPSVLQACWRDSPLLIITFRTIL